MAIIARRLFSVIFMKFAIFVLINFFPIQFKTFYKLSHKVLDNDCKAINKFVGWIVEDRLPVICAIGEF